MDREIKGLGPNELLLIAARGGDKVTLEFLLEQEGAVADSSDASGSTALIYAAKNGHNNIINILLKNWNASVDISDNDGRTALYYAAKHSYIMIIESLLKGGADPNKLDNQGKDPASVVVNPAAKKVIDDYIAKCEQADFDLMLNAMMGR